MRTRETTAAPLRLIRAAYTELTNGGHGPVLDGTAIACLPGRPVSIGEVDRLLHTRGTSDTVKDAVWAHLVEASRTEPTPWTTVCAGLALPGIRNAYRKARWTAPDFIDHDDLASAALAAFIAALDDIDLQRPRIASRLCNRAYTGARAYARELALYQESLVSNEYESHPPKPQYGHIDLVLEKAVADGALTEPQVELIWETFIDKKPVNEYAEGLGLSPGTITRRRRKAKRAIAEWFVTQRVRIPNWDEHVLVASQISIRFGTPDRQTCLLGFDGHDGDAVAGTGYCYIESASGLRFQFGVVSKKLVYRSSWKY